jgi:hypothetical protein
MEIRKYRILAWTSVFTHGAPVEEYEVQSQSATDPTKWETLGISPTLEKARRALLFHAPISGSGFG